jgi:hypothetical protein
MAKTETGAPKTDNPPLLEESQGPERKGKFLVMGARREGGQLAYVDFLETQTEADATGRALTKTGWATVEVYTRVSEHTRKK